MSTQVLVVMIEVVFSIACWMYVPPRPLITPGPGFTSCFLSPRTIIHKTPVFLLSCLFGIGLPYIHGSWFMV